MFGQSGSSNSFQELEHVFAKNASLVVALMVLFWQIARHLRCRLRNKKDKRNERILTPLNIAILIQDDLISQVGNELDITRDFINSLPAGSRVMVGYITSGTLQVRQPFTTDLDRAARLCVFRWPARRHRLLIPMWKSSRLYANSMLVGREQCGLLISDGLDTPAGLTHSAAGNTMDLHRAIKQANDRNVAVYSFYAPSVGPDKPKPAAASYGQSSLNRLANETGGKAFFQGDHRFVSFDSHFRRLREALNAQYAEG